MSRSVSQRGADELRNRSDLAIGRLCCNLQMDVAVKMSGNHGPDNVGTVRDQVVNLACDLVAVIAADYERSPRCTVAEISRIAGGVTQMHGVLGTELAVSGIVGGKGLMNKEQESVAVLTRLLNIRA